MAGAPLGNTNAAGRKNKPFAQAIERALMKRSKVDQAEGLLKVAEMLITQAEAGDMQAIKELADRTDGKAAQAITGPEGGPLQIQQVEVLIVDPTAPGSEKA